MKKAGELAKFISLPSQRACTSAGNYWGLSPRIIEAVVRRALLLASRFVCSEFRTTASPELDTDLPTSAGLSGGSGGESGIDGNRVLARIERYDHLYKSVGMTHRVQAYINQQIGRAERVDFWMRYPSNGAILATLKKRGILNARGFQVIEL